MVLCKDWQHVCSRSITGEVEIEVGTKAASPNADGFNRRVT